MYIQDADESLYGEAWSTLTWLAARPHHSPRDVLVPYLLMTPAFIDPKNFSRNECGLNRAPGARN